MTLCLFGFSAIAWSQAITYNAGFNAWIGSENANDKGSPAEGLVSDASYNFQFTYKFASKHESPWIPWFKATQQYISVRAVRFRSSASDSEGYEWLENLQAFGVVYGHRYFFNEDFDGFNIGWYLGIATAKNDGYEWSQADPNFYFEPYKENIFLPLTAIELNYHFDYKWIFVEPTFSLYVNSDTFSFAYYPSVIVGFQITK